MLIGLILLAIAGLLLWRGFTGQSPLDEIRKLVEGEAIFVRDPISPTTPPSIFSPEARRPGISGGGSGSVSADPAPRNSPQ